jgi:C1A family cysteine protease
MTIANRQIPLFPFIYTAVDWRDVGAVTQVHSQGNCGACWAITAVESVESAIFLSKGTLYDLSETEVIVCADECEMCFGGWPQDAFDYIMENKGIPLESTCSYDGAWLLKLSAAKAGTSDELR